MAQPMRVLLFGDQTEDPLPTIRDLYCQSHRSVFLSHFLKTAEDAVHQLACDLPSAQQRRLRFSSFCLLAETMLEDTHPDVVLRTLLLCVAQLGALILNLERDPTLLDHALSSRTIVLGYCSGLLPAAAAATAHSMVELLAIAPEIVATSVRLGLEVQRRSTLLEDCQESWARVVTGISSATLRKRLEEFHDGNTISNQKRVYISSMSESAITISGPPSSLDSFLSSEPVKNLTTIPLPITAAFHADHLLFELERIIPPGSAPKELHPGCRRIISPHSGSPYDFQNQAELNSAIIDDIMKNPINNVPTQESLLSILDDKSVMITSVGSNNTTKRLTKCLKDANINFEVTSSRQNTKLCNSSAGGDIAIVGMAGRFPGAESLEEFWKVLDSGLDLHREIPGDRFNVKTHYDPTRKLANSTSTPYGCFIDRPGMFDARLFNMSPREAAQTDPGQRLLLMSTYEALEMAGYTQEHDMEDRDPNVGTYFGQTIDDWKEYNAAEDVDMYYVTGGIRAFSAGRVNYHFKWEGPSYSVDSACSSSLLAVQLACSALQARECNMAVAGGSNILTGCNMYAGLSRGSFLSPTGSCKTFDASADGYCRGEGVGVIILKRLEDAVANRDNILAVVKAVATNHSAQAVSITHPHVETQAKLFREVLIQASVEPEDIDYVELHGTGTQAGDAAESKSMMSVLAKTPRSRPLTIGSIKPNIGHGEAAAGISSLIKTLLMLKKEQVVPHIGVTGQMNPKLPDFSKYNVHIASSQKLSRQGTRRVLLNNFSAAGGNTSIVLEDGPSTQIIGADTRTAHIVAVSAKTPFSLRENVSRFRNLLDSSNSSLPDIAYTSTARRMHHSLRKSYAVKDIGGLCKAMDKDINTWEEPKLSNDTTKVAFTFPGQGAAIMGVAKNLYDSCQFFRDQIGECELLCIQQKLPSFLDVLTGGAKESPSPAQNQLCLVAVETSLARLWQSWGIVPSVVIGHSLGEYAALCIAGVISTSDMVYLVAKRAEQMQINCVPFTHSMLSIRLAADSVRESLSGCRSTALEVACINGPNSTVVSGPSEEVTKLQQKLEVQGVITKFLEVPYSFHSKQMEPILPPFLKIANGINFAKPKIPMASTLLGEVVSEAGVFGAEYLCRQARESVNFPAALNSCVTNGLVNDRTLWMECGPGATCLSFVKASLNTPLENSLTTLEPNKDCWVTISKNLARSYQKGCHVKWTEFHKEHKHALQLAELPLYGFDAKNYWLDYRSRLDAPQHSQTPEFAPVFSSTCLQRIEEQSFLSTDAQVIFTSDFSCPELSHMARGHVVSGVGLCPSSIYAEMAFTAARYIFCQQDTSLTTPPMDLSNMEIFSPFMVKQDMQKQIFRVTATQSSSEPVKIFFHSQTGTEWKEHARCQVSLCDGVKMMEHWNSSAYLIRARSKELQEKARSGNDNVDSISRKMAYKLFNTVVDYSDEYQALKETFMSDDIPEASAILKFRTSTDDGVFTHSPYWIDSLAQIGGFCLNVNPPSGQDDVYISHGWKSMKILGQLSEKEQYRTYVRMQSTSESGVYAGNVYMFNEHEVVAVVAGLKFKQMKRTLLHTLLGVSSHIKRVSVVQPQNTEAPRGRMVNALPPPKAMEIILSEAGLERSELSDDAQWSDLGIDSILTISILQRLRTLTQMELPSSLFTTYSTVGELEKYFHAQVQPLVPHKLVTLKSEESRSRASSASTVRSVFSDASSLDACSSISIHTPPCDDIEDILKSIIIEEVGIQPSEAHPTAQFSDLGLDSLLSISVLSSLRELTGVSLPSSFFSEYQTFGDLRKYSQTQVPELKAVATKLLSLFKSKSILLQGIPSPGSTAVFLLPDGSGSALSYIDLPPISKSLPVYALFSPFHKCAESYTLPFETVASIFIEEIRRLQPQGPYLLAGWSMGGIFAYEVAHQLLDAGEKIQMLMFIDSPCPHTLPPLPAPTLDILENAGLFDGMDKSGKGIPEETRQHFLASVRTLEHFEPVPLAKDAKIENVVAVWAKDGMLEGLSEEKKIGVNLSDDDIANEARNWLFGVRSDYGPAGWDKLVGRKVECSVVSGNHFSVVKAPQMGVVGDVLKVHLQKALSC
ncbi:PKS16 protein [Cadophora sp. MPI-SDFR-AT-0126]|nr:PKS16 protein [Leotiomycetes sp. MPI-SDFR-AT-0126]